MAIEVEFLTITGMVGPGMNDAFFLRHAPSTGPNGDYDIALDPIDGPAQRYDIDFGVTHMDYGSGGMTGLISFDLADSDVKDVMNNAHHGVTGPLTMRILYNY